VDGVVFAVYGEEFPSRFFCGGHDEFAGGNEDFFVGEGDELAEFYSFVGGGEANYAYRGGNYDFDGVVGGGG